MNYLDLETLPEEERKTSFLKKKFKKQKLFSSQYVEYYLRTSTKYEFSTIPARIAIKNCDYDMDHIITRENKKIKTWWFNAKQIYIFTIGFDEFLIRNQTNYFEKRFLITHVRNFIKSDYIKEIYKKDDQWFFDRAYFFWQRNEYKWSSIYSNIHLPKMLTENDLVALNLGEQKIIDSFLIDEKRMKIQMELMFSKKEIGKLYDRRIFHNCL